MGAAMKRSFILAPVVSLLVLVACSSGDAGPKGDVGPAGPVEPSISGIVPGRAFLARKVDVTISGSGTRWAEGTTVDFGEGVAVEKLVVASPTAIVASLSIAATAPAGARDVTVDTDGAASTYKGAFTVESPLALTVKGTAAQGSVFFVTATSKDLSTPFDTTSESGGLFAPPTFTGVTLKDVPGVLVSVSDVSLYKVELTFVADVTSAAGKKAVSLVSGAEGTPQTAFPYPGGLDLAARQAAPLGLGSASSQSAKAPFESKLLTFSPAVGTAITDVVVTTKDADFAPKVILLPKSGRFDAALTGFVSTSTFVSTSADPIYAVVLDTSGKTGDFTILARSTAATTTTEAASNDTFDIAQAIAALPTIVTNGQLSSETDVDWYAVTVTAGDAGKKLRVITAPGDAEADPIVEIFKDDGTTAVGQKADAGFHENVLSPALTEGTYRIKISVSKESPYKASASRYQLALRLE
jgi:hypothetical protein